MVKIAPSLLAADFARLRDEVVRVEEAGADILHLDVMDGHFVPNLTFGPTVVAAIRKVTDLPLDVHLMVREPEKMLEDFRRAGADWLTVHAETCPNLHRTLGRIRELGAKAGVALNPATPPGTLEYVVDQLDLVLVMTVNPGFGGQRYLETIEPKIQTVHKLLNEKRLGAELAVDGGITQATAPRAIKAGATLLVAGTAVFGTPDLSEAIRHLRGS